MIIGIGSDLCDCRRIETTLKKHGVRFLNRIFTSSEQIRILKRNHQTASFAKLFSAKESVAKALGTGFTRGIFWTDIEIIRQEYHAPQVVLHNKAQLEFQRQVPFNKVGHLHLTMTDEWPYVQSFAILSAT